MSNKENEPIDMVILAGGFASRLKNIIDTPKILAPIHGVPFIEYLFADLEKQGVIQNVVLALGHRHQEIIEYCANRSFPFNLEFSIETTPLGTGGAVKNASTQIQSDLFFVMNGDSFINVDLRALVNGYRSATAAMGMVAVYVDDIAEYGSIEIEHNQVIAFIEKCGLHVSGWINSGVYVFKKSVVDQMPMTPFSLEKDFFPAMARQGIYAHKNEGFFLDIGTAVTYEIAQKIPLEVGSIF